MNEPQRKPWWRYWLARVLFGYFAAGPVLYGVGGILEWQQGRWMGPLVALWVIAMSVLPCMLATGFVFSFKYSVFGPYRRTPLPAEKPIWAGISRGAVGRVGIAGGGFCTPFHLFGGWWRVYSSRIAVAVHWVGTGFVHRDQFVSLTETYGGGWVLEHASPELANPIAFYNKDLIKAVQSIMPPR